ncbi:MAG: shikimate kinase [Pseudomonadota bacterium]
MSPPAEQKITVTLSRSLVLIGLMGAGKTSIGKRLAQVLHVAFQDSDHEIEAAAGLEVREIFEKYGEADFRAGEARVVQRLLTGPPGVIATGGGAFMTKAVRTAIAQNSVSVWLNADLETLWQRVKDKPTRPLLQNPRPRDVLAQLLEDRRATYALADVTVFSELGLSHDVMVRRTLEAVRAYDLAHPDQPPVLIRQTHD